MFVHWWFEAAAEDLVRSRFVGGSMFSSSASSSLTEFFCSGTLFDCWMVLVAAVDAGVAAAAGDVPAVVAWSSDRSTFRVVWEEQIFRKPLEGHVIHRTYRYYDAGLFCRWCTTIVCRIHVGRYINRGILETIRLRLIVHRWYACVQRKITSIAITCLWEYSVDCDVTNSPHFLFARKKKNMQV